MLFKALYSWIAFPVYAWQGISVRLRIERLLPADLPQEGRFNGIGEEIIPNVAVASASPPVLEGPDAPVITEGFVAPDPELVTHPE